ncbi:MAG: TIGR03086 family metal-binding protein [Tetrasphaera sp.]
MTDASGHGPGHNHRTRARRFTEVVHGVADWDAPTPVAEWRARDVVAHLTEWFPGFLVAGTDIHLPSGPSATDDPVGAWEHQRDEVQAVLDHPATSHRTYCSKMLPEMPLPEVIDQFYTADVFMHTWDLARASGQDDTLDEDQCAAMLHGMSAMEDRIRASGQFGEQQPVREDASIQQRFIAFIGRDPYWSPPA